MCSVFNFKAIKSRCYISCIHHVHSNRQTQNEDKNRNVPHCVQSEVSWAERFEFLNHCYHEIHQHNCSRMYWETNGKKLKYYLHQPYYHLSSLISLKWLKAIKTKSRKVNLYVKEDQCISWWSNMCLSIAIKMMDQLTCSA